MEPTSSATSTAGGDWQTAATWDTGAVPTSKDNVYIGSNSTDDQSTVTLNGIGSSHSLTVESYESGDDGIFNLNGLLATGAVAVIAADSAALSQINVSGILLSTSVTLTGASGATSEFNVESQGTLWTGSVGLDQYSDINVANHANLLASGNLVNNGEVSDFGHVEIGGTTTNYGEIDVGAAGLAARDGALATASSAPAGGDQSSIVFHGKVANYGEIHAGVVGEAVFSTAISPATAAQNQSSIVFDGQVSNSGHIDSGLGLAVSPQTVATASLAVPPVEGQASIVFDGQVTNGSGDIAAHENGMIVFNAGLTGGELDVNGGGTAIAHGEATGVTAYIDGAGSVLQLLGGGNSQVNFGGALAYTTALASQNPIGATGGELVLNTTFRPYTGNVQGFAQGDTIDVQNVSFSSSKDSYNATTGELMLSDSAHHSTEVSIVGTYTPSEFTFHSDGHGGTLIGLV